MTISEYKQPCCFHLKMKRSFKMSHSGSGFPAAEWKNINFYSSSSGFHNLVISVSRGAEQTNQIYRLGSKVMRSAHITHSVSDPSDSLTHWISRASEPDIAADHTLAKAESRPGPDFLSLSLPASQHYHTSPGHLNPAHPPLLRLGGSTC